MILSCVLRLVCPLIFKASLQYATPFPRWEYFVLFPQESVPDTCTKKPPHCPQTRIVYKGVFKVSTIKKTLSRRAMLCLSYSWRWFLLSKKRPVEDARRKCRGQCVPASNMPTLGAHEDSTQVFMFTIASREQANKAIAFHTMPISCKWQVWRCRGARIMSLNAIDARYISYYSGNSGLMNCSGLHALERLCCHPFLSFQVINLTREVQMNLL